MDLLQTTFDYDQIPAERRGEVREAALRIKGHLLRTLEGMVDSGNDLISVHDTLGDGAFGAWIAAEFSMSRQTATRLMQVARRFSVDLTKLVNFTPSVVYELAAPSTPDEVVDEAVSMAAEGEKVTPADIKELKAQWDAERKEFKQEISKLKENSKDAKATETDAIGQVQALQRELAQLRDERSTMLAELERAKSSSTRDAAKRHADDAMSDTEAVEKQVSKLMAAWNSASREAREEFLARIDKPVFDSTRVA